MEAADATIAQVMEVTGCSRKAAARAVEAAGEGGIELAVDLVLSTMSSHWSSASDVMAAANAPPPMKMVVIVREDLGMGVGKIAAQVSHATLGAYKATKRKPGGEETLLIWEQGGEPTIVLKVSDSAALDECVKQAEARELVACPIADAGRTEVAPGTVTCCAIGPAENPRIDEVTGRLSLLN